MDPTILAETATAATAASADLVATTVDAVVQAARANPYMAAAVATVACLSVAAVAVYTNYQASGPILARACAAKDYVASWFSAATPAPAAEAAAA
jgi:hypothetical protein